MLSSAALAFLQLLDVRIAKRTGEECRVAIRNQVEGTTGLKVRAVNVLVSDVYFPEDNGDAGGDA